MILWDIINVKVKLITRVRSFAAHRACIWDIHFLDCFDVRADPHQESGRRDDGLPPGSFVTCAADNTIRFWNVDTKAARRSKWRNAVPKAKELLHTINITPTNGQKPSIDSLDLCQGVPDRELPDRPSDEYSPRSLAVHPLCRHIACGDKQGVLRVYDLSNMDLVKCHRAHEGEILTLSFSPALKQVQPEHSIDGSVGVDKQVWTTAQSNEVDKSLVLLASAGRDRVVHVFDASNNDDDKEPYKPISVVNDHHSSVMIVKFTPDGQRLISCSGDKTMNLYRVEGPKISKIKSIQTPSGTINGLAVDATNKFAVTSGQEKRLNIWNIQSGKHMRAYKQDVGGELYKCDVDPSGMFVAACGFDKTVKILDFFSGDVVGEVGGHGELITSIKFSPDGKYVVTVAGDGCIFVWKVGEMLVAAMRERILELYSKIQKKQLAQQQMKPVAAIEVSNENKVPPEDSSNGNNAGAAAAGGASKWGQRLGDPSNLQILGQKVEVLKPERNKFTIDLNSSVVSGVSDSTNGCGDKLATSIEASDSVNLGDLVDDLIDDDDDDGDDLEPYYGSDFEDDSGFVGGGDNDDAPDESAVIEQTGDLDSGGDDGEDVLSAADQKLNDIEQQSMDIENWLEQQLKVKDANSVKSKSKDTGSTGTGTDENQPIVENVNEDDCIENKKENILSKSLTANYLQNIKEKAVVTGNDEVAAVETVNTVDNVSQLPTATSEEINAEVSERKQALIEKKVRESASVMAQMKDRLRVMGILESNGDGDSSGGGGDGEGSNANGIGVSDDTVDGGNDDDGDETDSDGEDEVPPLPPPFGMTGLNFPSDQTLLNGLQLEESASPMASPGVPTPSLITATSDNASSELMTASAAILLAGSEVEEDVTALEISPLVLPVVNTAVDTDTSAVTDDADEEEIKRKVANCKEVVNQMLRLSVQAKQMYAEVQSLASKSSKSSGGGSGGEEIPGLKDLIANGDLSVDESALVEPPQQSVFSPGGRSRNNRASAKFLEEMHESFQNLHASVASFSSFGQVSNQLPPPPERVHSESVVIPPLPPHTKNNNNLPRSNTDSELTDVSGLLEKYSDRIADMVSEKVAAKMSASMSMSSFSNDMSSFSTDPADIGSSEK